MSTAATRNDPNRHKRLRSIIAAGNGGAFHGVSEVPAYRRQPAYYIVFFDSPATGSTMTMPLAGLTPEAVRQHIAESNRKFGIA